MTATACRRRAATAWIPYPAIETYGADALRFYLLREVGFGQDGSVGYAHAARPLPLRARERARQPRQPLDGDDRALSRRRRAGRADRRDDRRRPAIASRPASRSGSTRSTSRVRSTRPGSSCARSTASSRSARPGSSPRATTRPTPRGSTRRCARSPTAAACSGSCCYSVMPGTCARLLAAVGADRGDLAWESAQSGGLPAGARVDSAAAQLFPRIESPPVAA